MDGTRAFTFIASTCRAVRLMDRTNCTLRTRMGQGKKEKRANSCKMRGYAKLIRASELVSLVLSCLVVSCPRGSLQSIPCRLRLWLCSFSDEQEEEERTYHVTQLAEFFFLHVSVAKSKSREKKSLRVTNDVRICELAVVVQYLKYSRERSECEETVGWNRLLELNHDLQRHPDSGMIERNKRITDGEGKLNFVQVSSLFHSRCLSTPPSLLFELFIWPHMLA